MDVLLTGFNLQVLHHGRVECVTSDLGFDCLYCLHVQRSSSFFCVAMVSSLSAH